MTYSDILADVRFLTGTDAVSYPTADITRNANRALADATALIVSADGRWQWDDVNHTTDPVATTNIVSGQQSYVFDPDQIKVNRVEVADADGNWSLLQPIDTADVFDVSLTDFMSGGGVPKFYDKIGASTYLYPAPDYSYTAGLKVYYQRGASEFTTADTTKTPGFATPFHRYVSLCAALDYAAASGNPSAARLRDERDAVAQAMRDFYSERSPDDRPRLSARRYRFN